MVLIAEFEVASPEDIPGETKFARLRRIAEETCRPLVKATTHYIPREQAALCSCKPVSMREASDIMLSRFSPALVAVATYAGVGTIVT